MLSIRMQRTGRKGHAMFRVIVQDSRQAPTSGKVVAQLGSYDPHTKAITLNKEKASFYLEHGAQPSERVARLLKSNDVKLPTWVQLSADKERTVRHAEKRRSTAPAKPVEEKPAETEATEEPVAEVVEEAPESAVEIKEAETPAEAEEAPAQAETAGEPAAEPAEKDEDASEPSKESPAK